MKFTLEESGKSINEQDLANFETSIGYQLPKDYRDFLLRHNGGRPMPNYWCAKARWQDAFGYLSAQYGQQIELITLYSLDDGPVNGIPTVLESMRGDIPANAIPIGDSSSPIFLLILNGQYAGSIFLWLTDTLPDQDQTKIACLGLVAKSFSEFLDGLVHVPA